MGCQSNDCIKYVTIIVTFLAVVVALFICGIQYITAFVTFLAVVVALFKDEIKKMIWRPDADIEIDYDSIKFHKQQNQQNATGTTMFIKVINKTRKLKHQIKDAKVYITKAEDVTNENEPIQLNNIPTPLPFWDFCRMTNDKAHIYSNINSFAFIKLFEFHAPISKGYCNTATEQIEFDFMKKLRIEFIIDASNFISKKIIYTFHWIDGTPFDSKVFKENIKICREDVNE